ncbi:MAG: hypothetical protein DYH13_04930 [Alphaproteobacteria bacterium PRO2]|nr:hypothetical protein [Alphaproteobacteria bacterium PRO2]
MTLIDVALLMIMLGLILVPLISQYNRWKMDNERGLTNQRYAAIDKAISDFYFENDRYPCPARMDRSAADADYGKEACNDADLKFSSGTVMIGAVPFATLKIPTETGLDGWSNKITYAVTAIQADPAATFGPGAIRVRGRQQLGEYECTAGISDYDPPGALHYVFVSHGPTGLGAFTADGIPRAACANPGTAADAANCINDNQFTHSVCMGSSTGPDFYDDIVAIKGNIPSKMWKDSISATQDIISNAESVGINNTDPQAALHVKGNIKALNTDSNTICAEDGSGCFTATMIGGTDPLMKCNSNPGATSSAMSGIGEARAKCQSGYTAFKVECPDGQFIQRLEADGGLVCGN